MAYRYGDRCQKTLFPQSIDEYIPNEAPVRAYDVIIGSLDFDELGINVDPHKVGCPQYDPKVMLKLLVYGYSYGVRSSRKLEREANYNLSFIGPFCGRKQLCISGREFFLPSPFFRHLLWVKAAKADYGRKNSQHPQNKITGI